MKESLDIGKILVVDDDKDIVETICASLDDAFPDIVAIKAYDGTQAIEEIEKHFPAIIILDLMMPNRSGFLVMEKISKIVLGKGTNKEAPPIIIIITGNHGLRHKVYAESLGAWRYLTKPFSMEALHECVRKAMALSKERK